MIQNTLDVEDIPPDITLTRLIDRHGTWTTLRSLTAVLWRRRPRRPGADALPDRLRRDIGLPERGADRPPRLDPWL